MAESYVNHRWTGGPEHVKHGLDEDGVRVDTPDAGFKPPGRRPGWWSTDSRQVNVGIPFCYGGNDTPETFDAKLRRGFWAGDVLAYKKKSDRKRASRNTAGVDERGFIARCWKLKRPVSGPALLSKCQRLDGIDELLPGDVLISIKAGALLFASFSNKERTELTVYRTGSELHGWRVTKQTVTEARLKSGGFGPYRYRGMRR